MKILKTLPTEEQKIEIVNLFFENNVNNFKLGHENYEKSIFNELPYGKCETFDQAYELMKNKE